MIETKIYDCEAIGHEVTVTIKRSRIRRQGTTFKCSHREQCPFTVIKGNSTIWPGDKCPLEKLIRENKF